MGEEEKNSGGVAVSSLESQVHGSWRPIKTAPKTGVRVLLAIRGKGVCVGFFGPKYSTYGVNYGNAWGNGTSWRDYFESPPTHWMPLPDPPELDTSAVSGELTDSLPQSVVSTEG